MKKFLFLILSFGVAGNLLAHDLVHLSGVVEKPIANQAIGESYKNPGSINKF